MPKDIQELIHPSHRDLVEAIPRGAAQSGMIAGLFFGIVAGVCLAMVIPKGIIAATAAALFVAHRIYVTIIDRKFDRQMEELKSRDLDWVTDADKK